MIILKSHNAEKCKRRDALIVFNVRFVAKYQKMQGGGKTFAQKRHNSGPEIKMLVGGSAETTLEQHGLF